MNRITIVLLVIIFLLGVGHIFKSHQLDNLNNKIELMKIKEDSVYNHYIIKMAYYDSVDNLLHTSLSAKINNTYITNIYKNETQKKEIANLDSTATDSLFTYNLKRAKARYSYLFD